MKIFKELHQLIFPGRCISCRNLGESLCRICRLSWSSRNYITHISHNPPLKVFSSIAYSDIAGRVLLAAKESHLKSADLLVADAISYSLRQWLKLEWIDTLVPIPSRKSAVRKRGRQFIEEITELVTEPINLAISTPLHHSRQLRDQSGLNFEERRNNLEGALVVKGKPEGLGRVLLVDDLVTTGATLNEAARALRYAGIEVIGAVTAAVAQTVR